MRLIDADEFSKSIIEACRSETECVNHLWFDENIIKLIDNAPTIKTFTLLDIEEQYRKGLEKGLSEWETERPQGEWLQYRKGHYTGVKCSLCDTIMDFTTNYCPKCGADMRGN